jgi:two-component system, OmpR family, phosphate regulon sensor histidine kinase PhoR
VNEKGKFVGMHKLRNIKWLPLLMALTILAIAAFQVYWLQKAYEREEVGLRRQTNMLFQETVRNLRASRLKLDKLDTSRSARLIMSTDAHGKPVRIEMGSGRKMNSMIDAMMEKVKDSNRRSIVVTEKETSIDSGDSVRVINRGFGKRQDRMLQFLFDVDSLQDSIKVRELDSAYARRLNKENLDVPFEIKRVPTREKPEPVFNEVTLGFANPITYRMELGKTSGLLLMRIGLPILFSIFLIGITLLSFTLLYRNLLRQKRLSDIKNEFISNITHELKTPIATVSVAIEALRSFNATMDPKRTREYLDISASELQRLSMLVDKVLKLSMFEKKAIELKYEHLDMKELVQEVTSSMRLQFEKHHADVQVKAEGDTGLEGDRLHLVSVIYNLLDNALKYSNGNPKIGIDINGSNNHVELNIADSGIGIPGEYQHKIFEKFFRVPTGNLHNAKGYGLGLSYVAHVIKRHKGSIKVESVEGDGSRFLINLPRHEMK